MGVTCKASCHDCGKEFKFNKGSGFTFHLLRCDQCGQEITVTFNEIMDLHYQYLKGSKGAYGTATKEQDKYIRENLDITPISQEQYFRLIEAKLEKCKCGGGYSFNAEPRCPQCRSVKVKVGTVEIKYD